MIRTALKYHRPHNFSEVSEILAAHRDKVAIVAGGSQILPRMGRNEISVDHIVDLRGLPLRAIEVDGDELHVGAMATYGDILASPIAKQFCPLLPRAAAEVTGGRQIVDHATLVGACCFNYPGSDMPAVLVATNATFKVHGLGGERRAAANRFFRGVFEVDLLEGEFVTGFSAPRHERAGYCKIKHATGSWPIATASAIGTPDGSVSITLGAVQAIPAQFAFRDFGALEAQVKTHIVKPFEDDLAPGWYRARIAAVAARRAVTDMNEASHEH